MGLPFYAPGTSVLISGATNKVRAPRSARTTTWAPMPTGWSAVSDIGLRPSANSQEHFAGPVPARDSHGDISRATYGAVWLRVDSSSRPYGIFRVASIRPTAGHRRQSGTTFRPAGPGRDRPRRARQPVNIGPVPPLNRLAGETSPYLPSTPATRSTGGPGPTRRSPRRAGATSRC